MSTEQWSDGYATQAGYTYGYFDALNPRRAAFAMLLHGLEGPPAGPCCELGFGQGVSIAMHAATQPERRWWGTDFMPEHATHARQMVDAAGVDAEVADQSFEEFAARDDLPRFAFVGLHGVWSWISAANRARIVDFLRRRLMPGGVVYVGFDVLAGNAAWLPLRDIMLQHYRAAGSARPALVRAREALDYVQRLVEGGIATTEATPALKASLTKLSGMPDRYVLHHLLNEDWAPQSFAEVDGALAIAKLSFACPAELQQRLAGVDTSPAQDAMLAQIEPAGLRGAVRDALLGTTFRRGYWVRGAQPLARGEAVERLEQQRVVLAMPAKEVPRRISGRFATRTLDAAQLEPLLEQCARADAAVAIGALVSEARTRGHNPNGIVETVSALLGLRAFELATDEATAAAAQPAAQRLNAWLLTAAARRAQIVDMASPLTGGAVPVADHVQMMLAARAAAPSDPTTWPGRVWDALQADGQKMIRGGSVVTDRAKALEVLSPMVPLMNDSVLPLLRRLRVVA